MKNPFLTPFIFLIFPCAILYSIYMGLQRYAMSDLDAALAYFGCAIFLGITIFLAVRKNKK